MKIRKTPQEFVRGASADQADPPAKQEAIVVQEPKPKQPKPKAPPKKKGPTELKTTKVADKDDDFSREEIFPNTRKISKENFFNYNARIPNPRYERLWEYINKHGRRWESVNFLINEGIELALRKRGFASDDQTKDKS